MIEEMLNSSYYVLDFKENEDFVYNQVDSKKEATISKKRNGQIKPMVRMMYGEYSDFTTPNVDKWNMQTIPGKDLTITPDRIKMVTCNGKTNLVDIVVSLYERYQHESKNPIMFTVLDKFVKYVKEKIRHYKRTS